MIVYMFFIRISRTSYISNRLHENALYMMLLFHYEHSDVQYYHNNNNKLNDQCSHRSVVL